MPDCVFTVMGLFSRERLGRGLPEPSWRSLFSLTGAGRSRREAVWKQGRWGLTEKAGEGAGL